MSGTGNEHKRKWSPLVQAGPTCLRVSTVGEMWQASMGRGTRCNTLKI
jgi:hypothetical protein